VDDRRLWTNLLSSHPLTYNLFAPLKLDPHLATAFFHALLPDFVTDVIDIAFEHSPARGDAAFTGDRTAFDAIAVVRTPNKRLGFVAIEMKYSENPSGLSRPCSPRLDELAAGSGMYRSHAAPELRQGPEQQFWREHLLCRSMIERLPYEEGRFIVIHPALNSDVARVVERYRDHLIEPEDVGIGFDSRSLEDCVHILAQVGAGEQAIQLTERYLDFTPVERLIFDEFPEALPLGERVSLE
jgi:hypothetical protein